MITTSQGHISLPSAPIRESVFNVSIVNGKLVISPYGEISESIWRGLPDFYPGLVLDYFTLMPNHMHGVLFLTDNLSPDTDLSMIIRGFKSWSARRINEHRDTTGTPVWQRSFYDRVIRNEKELQNIREYIQNNPRKWSLDNENPKNMKQSRRDR